jgi:hypothetical protein
MFFLTSSAEFFAGHKVARKNGLKRQISAGGKSGYTGCMMSPLAETPDGI